MSWDWWMGPGILDHYRCPQCGEGWTHVRGSKAKYHTCRPEPCKEAKTMKIEYTGATPERAVVAENIEVGTTFTGMIRNPVVDHDDRGLFVKAYKCVVMLDDLSRVWTSNPLIHDFQPVNVVVRVLGPAKPVEPEFGARRPPKAIPC